MPDLSQTALRWPAGDGEMARRIREHDWAATPLGPVEGWPERLRAAVELMLASRQPVCINWGPDDGGVTLYNEGYIPILGAKHPRALGGSYREVWPEIWDEYRPVIAATMAGEAHSFVDRPVPLAGRDGRPMSWFTFSWTPLRDGAGAAAGFFCAATETTDAVLARERLREGEERLRVATEANGIGTWELVLHADGTTTALTSPRHDAIFGHDEPVPEWDAGIFLSHVLPGHRDGVARRLREAVEAGRAWRFEAPIRPAGGGGPRWIAAHGQPVERDAGGRAVRFVGVVRDVTSIHDTTAALREGEARQAFLLRLTDALRPLADAGAIAAEASRLLGEHLRADRTFMTEVDADGMTLHVRDEHLRAGASSVLGRYRFDQFGAFVGRALHRGRALAVEDVSARADLDAAERANYAAVGIAAYLLVPLVRDGRLAAYLTVNHRTPRAWTEADRAVARQAADRAWADMERARAEAALRESEERQAFLLTLGDAMRARSGTNGLIEVAARLIGEHLAASRIMFAEFDEARGVADIFHGWFADGAEPFPTAMRLEDYEGPILDDLRAGRTVRIEDVRDPAPARPDLAAIAGLGVTALLSVPLVVGGRLAVNLSVHQHTARHWTDADVALVREVAERLWADLVRARAEAALRESEARNALLVRFADEVRGLSDPALVAEASCRILTERLGTERALWAVVDRDTREYVAEWAFRADGTRAEPSRRPLDPRAPFAAEHLAGRPVAYDDGEADPRIPGPVAAAMAERGLRAGIAVPVPVAGTLRAVLNTSRPTAPRRWRPEEVAFVEALAGRAWAEIERARAEAALRESEGRFRALAEAIEDVFYMTDLDRGALLYLSPSYERVWGRPAAELLADLSGFEAALHPDDRPVFEAAKAAQARGEPVAGEYRIVRPDGGARWIHDRSFPVPGGPGRRAAGIAADVTARKRAEDALRASEERLRLIVENARDHAIFATDPEDRITDWLPGARAVFGWTAEEAVGRPAAMIFTPEDRERGEPEREIETARRDGAAPNVRWHLRRDGSRVFIQGTVAAMRDADGTLRGFLKIGQDVTERREAEERLRRSEALFRTLATGIQALVFRGGPDGARAWGSPQWVDFTGLSFEASLGSGWLEAIHPDDREATLAAWGEAAGSGEYYAEHRIRRAADGEWRWHQTRARPRDGMDGVGGEWVGAMTDVHDMRELQGRQSVLVAELQHRTRNLLAVVRSLAEKTMAGAAGLDEFRDRFRDRLSALSRVQGLLSRLAEGERVTFDELIRAELTALGAVDADGRGPQVALDGPAGVRLRSGTVQTFALALHELATNAVKYGALSRPEGRLRVSWRLEPGADGERRLHVEWHESGVAVPAPADGAPRRTGYGRELIERALPYQLKARTRYELGPDGVRCTIAVPVSAERTTGGPGHA